MRRRFIAVLVGMLTALGLTIGTAAAKQYERGHFDDPIDFVVTDFCGAGFDVHHTGNVWGSYVITGDSARYRENVHLELRLTNLDNGEYVTEVLNASVRDQRITDNPDNTQVIETAGTGGDRWYDSNDKLLFQDGGGLWVEILTTDDYEFIDFLGVTKDTGKDDITAENFCDQLVPALS